MASRRSSSLLGDEEERRSLVMRGRDEQDLEGGGGSEGDPPEEDAQAQADVIEEPEEQGSENDEDEDDDIYWGDESYGDAQHEMGKWKSDLQGLNNQEGQMVTEEDLHVVRWGALMKHFAQMSAVLTSFLVFALVSECSAVSALPLFIGTFFQVVILVECCTCLPEIVMALASVVTTMIGILHGGPSFSQALTMWMFPAMLLALLFLWYVGQGQGSGGVLQSSRCWQALSGTMYVDLSEEVHLAALCKALVYKEPTTFWSQLASFAKRHLEIDIRSRLGQKHQEGHESASTVLHDSCISIEMVRVDEQDQDRPDVPLVLSGVEVDPGEYVLKKLVRKSPEKEDEPLEITYLQRLLKSLAVHPRLTDKMVDNWLTDLPVEEEKQQDVKKDGIGKKPPEPEVRKWMYDSKLQPWGKDTISAQLRRARYWDGLFEHWAVRAAWCVAFCSLLSLPMLRVFEGIDAGRREVCDVGGPHHLAPVGPQYLGEVLVCDGQDPDDPDSCVSVCKTFLLFVSVVHDKFQISYVELLITLILLPVSVFTFAVRAARQAHNRSERMFLLSLPEPKRAVNEVMAVKENLEDVFKLSSLIGRCIAAFRACRGADSALGACGSITEGEFDLTAARGFNKCLKQVMVPVTEMKSTISCDLRVLTYGIAYDDKAYQKAYDDYVENSENDDEAAKTQEAEEEAKRALKEARNAVSNPWTMLKYENKLGGTSDRNYKIMFDLQMLSKDSWGKFKEWCKEHYKEQADYIKSQRLNKAQDSGTGCHLKKDAEIFDIMVPRGFSLTHVYVPSMPDDGLPRQIELCGEDDETKRRKNGGKSNKELLEGFFQACDDQLIECIKCAKVDYEEELAEEEGPQRKEGDIRLDQRLKASPIVARFALSEQYFNNMKKQEDQKDLGEICKDWKPSWDFTDFVDYLLEPRSMHIPTVDDTGVYKEDGKRYLFWGQISVLMGDENPRRSLFVAFKACLEAMSVHLLCGMVAALIPLLRAVGGGNLFPQPFSMWMLFMTIGIWFQLVNFFADFKVARTRLSLISQCLHLLETKTLTLSAPPAEGAAGEEQSPDAPQRKNEDSKDARPFDLVVVANKTECEGEYQEKTLNVQMWHASVAHLRVFVSTSRLTAQTLLAAAAVIVAFLLLISFLQTCSGQGPSALVDLARHGVHKQLQGAVEFGGHGARRLHEQIGEALEGLVEEHHLAAGLASASLAAGPGAGAGATVGSLHGSVREAARTLKEELMPVRASLYEPLLRQYSVLSEGRRRLHELQFEQDWGADNVAAIRRARRLGEVTTVSDAVNSMSSVTKTHIFTAATVLLVMLYSIRLIWNIVQVNGYFDRHVDLMLKQRGLHTTYHNRRERTRLKEASSGASDGAETGSQATAEEGDETTSEGPALSRGASGSPETGAQAKSEGQAAGKGPHKDPERQLYERMLNNAVKVAKKSGERFPLKLFGFVISTNLLATWVGLATAPLFSQVTQMAPPVAVAACGWIENSSWLASLQEQMDLANPEMHIKVRTLVHDNLCVPLQQLLEEKLASVSEDDFADSVTAKLNDEIEAAKQRLLKRRLQDAEVETQKPTDLELSTLVRRWWHASADVPADARFATARSQLVQLREEGHALLASAPEAVLRAFDHKKGGHPEAGFWLATGMARPHLELALRSGASKQVGAPSLYGVASDREMHAEF